MAVLRTFTFSVDLKQRLEAYHPSGSEASYACHCLSLWKRATLGLDTAKLLACLIS